jgi:prophage antirepressor-like protein
MPNTAQADCAAVTPFSFNETPIRTVYDEGQPWFVAKDVCSALDIAWRSNTLASVPDEWKGVRKLRPPKKTGRGGLYSPITVISEPAVYKLAFRSNKPEADRFTNWVASEVLPSIRQTGGYHCALSTKADRRPLKDLVAVYVGLAPLSFRDAWKLIHAKFGVTTVDDLTVDQVREACDFLQQRIDAVVAKANQKPKALPAPPPTLSGADLLEFSRELDLYKTEEDSFLTLQRHHFEDMRYKIRTAEYGSKENKAAMNLHLQGYYRLMGLCYNLMGVAAEVYSETAKQTEQALKIAGKI